MRRGTTEKKSISITGSIDLENVQRAVMTIGQGSTRIHQDVEFDSDGKGSAVYTPDQTLKLGVGKCKEQVKMLLNDGTVVATNIVEDVVSGDVLNEESL